MQIILSKERNQRFNRYVIIGIHLEYIDAIAFEFDASYQVKDQDIYTCKLTCPRSYSEIAASAKHVKISLFNSISNLFFSNINISKTSEIIDDPMKRMFGIRPLITEQEDIKKEYLEILNSNLVDNKIISNYLTSNMPDSN